MKLKTLLVILLLMSPYVVNAFGEVADAEHWEKVHQLDQLAERFKAETGFRGEISHNGALSHLGIFRGKFADIPFSADADTLTFRQACDRIIDRLLPYTLATRSQLTTSRISKGNGRIETEYYQTVNGYKVEGGGLLLIAYDVGRSRFSISNGTVELPDEPLGIIISEYEAELIALKDMNDEHCILAKVYNLFYSKEGSDSYYLAYFVIVDSNKPPLYDYYVYWIDAINGRIRKTEVAERYE